MLPDQLDWGSVGRCARVPHAQGMATVPKGLRIR
jgi:hypothetical protein